MNPNHVTRPNFIQAAHPAVRVQEGGHCVSVFLGDTCVRTFDGADPERDAERFKAVLLDEIQAVFEQAVEMQQELATLAHLRRRELAVAS